MVWSELASGLSIYMGTPFQIKFFQEVIWNQSSQPSESPEDIGNFMFTLGVEPFNLKSDFIVLFSNHFLLV